MAICGWSLLARILGVFSTLVLLVGGILTVISLSPICWGVGAYMLVVGLVVGLFEVPFVFEKMECTKGLAARVREIGPGHRALLYVMLSIFIFFCIGVSSYIAAFVLIATGFFYGLVWLGPRGGQARAQQAAAANTDDKEQLMGEEMEGVETQQPAATGGSAASPSWMQSLGESVGKSVGEAAVKGAVAAAVQGAPAWYKAEPESKA